MVHTTSVAIATCAVPHLFWCALFSMLFFQQDLEAFKIHESHACAHPIRTVSVHTLAPQLTKDRFAFEMAAS